LVYFTYTKKQLYNPKQNPKKKQIKVSAKQVQPLLAPLKCFYEVKTLYWGCDAGAGAPVAKKKQKFYFFFFCFLGYENIPPKRNCKKILKIALAGLFRYRVAFFFSKKKNNIFKPDLIPISYFFCYGFFLDYRALFLVYFTYTKKQLYNPKQKAV
jgi:hypothetical protein